MSKQTTGLAAGNRRAEGHDQSAGIRAGTIILTLEGALPVEHLSEGDRIITRDGVRVLRGLSVRVLRDAAAIRIGAGTLGNTRPQDDLTVAPGQKILVRDWRAQALYGTDRAMIPAARLVDGEFVRNVTLEELRLFTLHLDAPAVIYAGGIELGVEPEMAEA